MKKKLLTLAFFMMMAFYGFSQLELKVDPINALFGQIPVSLEYVITPNIGAEAWVGYSFGKDKNYDTKTSGVVINGLFKYYFKPDDGGDKFYAFPYVRYVNRKFDFEEAGYTGTITSTYTAFGAGFGAGYKIVAESGLLFDFALGVGKNFKSEYTYSDPTYNTILDLNISINIIGRISVGYRFGGGK
jgi:hypothetical protein